MDEHGEKGDKGDKGEKGEPGGKGAPCLEDHDLLIRIDSKLDNIVEKLDDHEDRIRDVEGNLLKVLGVGTLAGFIAGWFSKFFGGNG
jgi:hypothetical protein